MNIYRNTVIFKGLVACFFLLNIMVSGYAQIVPDQMEYCGMKLSFTPEAKQRLGEYLDKIYENPRYYNQMVMKARTYMPIIEEALNHHHIPEDFKYLAIQESGLKANATSISKTVGFWQLSTQLATQLGLQVDEQLDERMHIFRSSSAISAYFEELFQPFDNWVYATIAYHEGINETAPFTNPTYYGQSFMMIDGDLHWYALKVLAYKIAYEDAIQMAATPNVWLEPVLVKGGTPSKKIYKDQGVDLEEFFAYNLWFQSRDRLPKDRYYTVYIPRKKDTYIGYINDPVFELEKLTGTALSTSNKSPKSNAEYSPVPYDSPSIPNDTDVDESMPILPQAEDPASNASVSNQDERAILATKPIEAKSISSLDSNQYVLFEIKYDIDYQTAYIEYDANYSLIETANKFGFGFNSLLTNNQLKPNEKPEDGKILYLFGPTKVPYHIVEPKQSLAQIAFRYSKPISYLQERNRMQSDNFNIYVGQKLYLKKKKPKGEKMIILRGKVLNNLEMPLTTDQYAPTKILSSPTAIEENDSTSQKNEISYPIKNEISNDNQSLNKWINHEVLEGETLLGIAEKYNTSVEIIKQINKLNTNHIIPGHTLRILTNK